MFFFWGGGHGVDLSLSNIMQHTSATQCHIYTPRKLCTTVGTVTFKSTELIVFHHNIISLLSSKWMLSSSLTAESSVNVRLNSTGGGYGWWHSWSLDSPPAGSILNVTVQMSVCSCRCLRNFTPGVARSLPNHDSGVQTVDRAQRTGPRADRPAGRVSAPSHSLYDARA